MKKIPIFSTDVNLLLLLVFFAYNPTFSQESSGIFFEYNNLPLSAVIDSLISEHELPIVYQDKYLENVRVSVECHGCSAEEAVSKILDQTPLLWIKRKNQFIIISEKELPNTYNLSGYIFDKITDEFIPNANVSVEHTYIGTVSNENGFFSIPQFKAETCTLNISFIGYQSERVALQSDVNKSQKLMIHLNPIILTTDDITVTGEQVDIMKTGERLSQISYSPRNIAALPNLGENDVIRSLQMLPGAQSGNTGSAGLFIRGGTPDQNQIMLDGMTLYQMDHFFGFVSSINAQAVKDIQVFRGNYPARYGGKVSSLIQLTGRNGDMNRSRFSIFSNQLSQGFTIQQPLLHRGSLLLTHRQTINDIRNSGLFSKIYNFLTEGSALNIGQEFVVIDTSVIQSYKPEFKFQDLNLKIMLLPSKTNVLSASYYTSKDDLYENNHFIYENASSIFEQQDRTQWLNEGFSTKFSHQWSNNDYSQLLFSRSIYHSDHELYRSSETTISDSIIVPYSESFNEKNKIADNTLHFNHDFFISDHQIQSGFWSTKYSSDFSVTQSNETAWIDTSITADLLSFYVQDKLKLIEKMELELGLRYSKYSLEDQDALLPRISLNFKKNQSSVIYVNWGKYKQYIQRFSNDFIASGSKFVWLLSSANVKPSEADKVSLGYQKTGIRYDLNAEIYYNYKTDISNFSRLYLYSNLKFPADAYNSGLLLGGSEISKGFEFFVRKFAGPIRGWISYNYSSSLWHFPELNSAEYFPADHERTHDFKTVIMTNWGNWHWTISWLLFSGKPFTEKENIIIEENENGNVYLVTEPYKLNQSRLPISHRMDLSITRSTSWKNFIWEFGLSIFNLYNFRYISHKRYLFYSPGEEIVIKNVKVMGFTPTLFFSLSK